MEKLFCVNKPFQLSVLEFKKKLQKKPQRNKKLQRNKMPQKKLNLNQRMMMMMMNQFKNKLKTH